MEGKIAFVCQRYGREVNGGAEAECRAYAERLAQRCGVEVITTCAKDYVTWKNEYPAGVSVINGVTVRRFPVERQRDAARFDRVSARLIGDPEHSREDEEAWLREQGPLAPAALDYLRAHAGDYAAVFFMTYLYYLTAEGIGSCAGRAILIPTAHDELPIYLRCYRDVFAYADGYVYNSRAERRFVESRFLETSGKPCVTVGAGVEPPRGPLPDVRQRFGLAGDYILYAGRIDEAKGCAELFRYFAAYKRSRGGELKLVLTGKAAMPLPERDDVVPLGFVTEEEKFAVMAGAKVFVLASRFESLSIVALESMSVGCPVLLNGECEVLRDHVLASRAGLYFRGGAEFGCALSWLLEHPDARAAMGRNGREYVAREYNWASITDRLWEMAEKVAAGAQRGGHSL